MALLRDPSNRLGDRAGITLGFLVDWLEDDYQNVILGGALEAARERGVRLICFAGGALGTEGGALARSEAHGGAAPQRNAIYDLAGPENVDGMMILSGTLGNRVGGRELARFCERYRPLPLCSIAVALPGMPSVLVDNAAGMRAALVHLLLDHRMARIAFIRGPTANEEAERRYGIYRDVLTEYGLSVDPRLVVRGDFQRDSGADAVRELVDERHLAFDAIVAASDYMALGAMEALAARGIRVPEDVAVVGFDDVEEARCSVPPLTTVRQPFADQGRWAVDILLDSIQGRPTPDRTMLHTEFVPRRSCGCKASPEGELITLEDAVFAQARQRLAGRRSVRGLAETGEALLGTGDLGALGTAVAAQLPRLGIASGYLVEYGRKDLPAGSARLLLAYGAGRDNSPVTDGRLFPPGELAPAELRPKDRSPSYVVLPLFFRNEQLGFAMLELGSNEGVIYEALRDQMSFALKGALLLKEVIDKDRERQRLLRLIVGIAPDMHRIQPLEELFERILRHATELFEVVEVEGFLATNDEGKGLLLRAATPRFRSAARDGTALPRDVGLLVEKALREGKITVTESATVLPLRVGDVPRGVVFIDRGEAREADAALLEIFSNQAAAAIRNLELYEMATLDPLTGAYARRFFDDWLAREVRTAFHARHELSFLMVDMDNMKRINDVSGHPFGDQALSTMARVLRQAAREHDVVGRYGGDEFSVILPRTGVEGATAVANRILGLLGESVLEDPRGLATELRCSLGLSTLGAHGFTPDEMRAASVPSYFQKVSGSLIRRADEALYHAKKRGGARLSAGTPTLWTSLEN